MRKTASSLLRTDASNCRNLAAQVTDEQARAQLEGIAARFDAEAREGDALAQAASEANAAAGKSRRR
jgi:hypothetical protein